jgi:hypothetical protein
MTDFGRDGLLQPIDWLGDAQSELMHAIVAVLGEFCQQLGQDDARTLSELADCAAKLKALVESKAAKLQDALAALREQAEIFVQRTERAESLAMSAAAEVDALSREVATMRRQVRQLHADVRMLKGQA